MNTNNNQIVLSQTNAEILASLVCEDIRGYAQQHPQEFADFCKAEAKKQSTTSKKKRKSKMITKEEPDNDRVYNSDRNTNCRCNRPQ